VQRVRAYCPNNYQDKALSSPTEPVFVLQGVGWLTRKALGLATVTQSLHSFVGPPDDDPSAAPVTHINIDQTATGGLKGTSEKRNLDWKERPHSDYLFGDLIAKSRWNTLAKIGEENKGKEVIEGDAKYLLEGWLPETTDGEVVESFVNNEKAGWTGWQVWGFADVNGDRWLVRRFVIRKGDKVERVRLVYAWAGEN
jgi:hypothetical protein